jgi:hypothetical protein
MFDPVFFSPFTIAKDPLRAEDGFADVFAKAQEEAQPEDVETLLRYIERQLKIGKDGDFGMVFMTQTNRSYIFGPTNLAPFGDRDAALDIKLMRAFAAGLKTSRMRLEADTLFMGGVVRDGFFMRRMKLAQRGEMVLGTQYS